MSAEIKVGDRVKVLYGPVAGKTGTVDSIAADYEAPDDFCLVRLDGGSWVTVPTVSLVGLRDWRRFWRRFAIVAALITAAVIVFLRSRS